MKKRKNEFFVTSGRYGTQNTYSQVAYSGACTFVLTIRQYEIQQNATSSTIRHYGISWIH